MSKEKSRLKKDLEKIQKPIFLVGDGSRLCYNTLKAEVPNLILPPAHLELQRASGVAMAAMEAAAAGELQSPETLVPNYLRLSQAERERLSKRNGENQKLKGDS